MAIPNWLHLSQLSGTGNTVVYVTADTYTGLSDREATLFVSGETATTEGTVIQKAVPSEYCVYYTTNDGNAAQFYTGPYELWGANYVDSSYVEGRGIIVFDRPVTRVGTMVFQNATNLQTITIPSTVTEIGLQAFYGCSALTDFHITSAMTSVGNAAFAKCSSLSSVTIDNGITAISPSTFMETAISSVTIPDSVTSIGDGAFYQTPLTDVTIGSGVTQIGHTAFGMCNSLTAITITADTAPSVENDTFYTVHFNGTLSYPMFSDYSSWLSNNQYYLGFYQWNTNPIAPVEYRKYLTFTAGFEGGTLVYKKVTSSTTAKTLQYRRQGGEWTGIVPTTAGTTVSLAPNESIEVKASTASSYNNVFGGSTGITKISGNLMSLFYLDSFANKTSFPGTRSTNCVRLFANMSGLTDASELILPVMSIRVQDYNYMFQNDADLIYPPKELPATFVGMNGYDGMFLDCTSLVRSPDIADASVLGSTQAFQYMFRGCSSLSYIKSLYNGSNGNNMLRGWVSGVSQTGIFVKSPSSTWLTGINGIPSGWTVYNEGEEPSRQMLRTGKVVTKSVDKSRIIKDINWIVG